LSVDRERVAGVIGVIAFAGDVGGTRVVRMAARMAGDSHVTELWHAIDLSDLSTVRTFVASSCEPSLVYEVDFFSRNELPRPPATMPSSWLACGFRRGSSLVVTDTGRFRGLMGASDILVAVPTYRFDFVADDVQEAIAGGHRDKPLRWALQYMSGGYSYVCHDATTGLAVESFSIATGVAS